MKINAAGIALIKSFEGCKLETYKDIVGILTIGYGVTDPKVAFMGNKIDQATADKYLMDEIASKEAGVSKMVTVPLTDGQFSALVCLSYNIGLGALKGSTLLRKLNAGDVAGAGSEFLKWDRAGSKEVAGLKRRRQAERDLFVR